MVSPRLEIDRPNCVHCGKPYGIRQMDRGVFLGYYVQYKPFCTMRCALAYARSVYNSIQKQFAGVA